MEKFSNFVCKHKNLIFILSCILLVFSFVGMKLTRVNYDILVYLPKDIKTIEGQNILTDDFNMGSYSVALADNLSSKEIIKLEDKIRKVKGVNKVVSAYDVLGTSIPMDVLPNDITSKVHDDDTDLIFITFNGSTSSKETLNAVEEIRNITNGKINQGGMSSMVLDTMNLSEKEIGIYIVIAVILCVFILVLSLDSYVIPFVLLANIGFAIMFNLGSNIFLGEISYITKALVAVLQLGVTTDFSIFLYHSYESKKEKYKTKEDAMKEAIKETFSSVMGSSFTTIVGFLVLCLMRLTLGKDLGIVMAKGVLLGVITVITLFPSMLLIFDNVIEKTKHKSFVPNFSKLNKFIVKHNKIFLVLFLILLVPFYLANSKVSVYYKLDRSLPSTLESIKTNDKLKESYNIVSPEIILINNNIKPDKVVNMISEVRNVDGIDFVLSLASLKEMGITNEMIPKDILDMVETNNYQMIFVNSTYDIATDELNNQITKVNKIIEKYDKDGILAGEGPLMKDLIKICDTDFRNVNVLSALSIFLILFFVLKSYSLPLLLISIIEFAIFMNIGISYLNGTILPFIAPIVLGTIQLGATIDYAILMTTTYIKKRHSGIDKNKAMLDTLNYSGVSVFVSGMCFFAATFGVGMYSKIEMIGSLCTLISRGAIISMLVVITILPGVLLILDKLIMKTTKKGNNKMKKNQKKIAKKSLACLLILGTLITTVPVNALTKNETVYSKLNYNGEVKNTIVNEYIINNNDQDKINDYSNLENIVSINDNKFSMKDNNITWESNKNNVLYQGTTNKKLPVNLNVTYKLNGKDKKLDDMLGKKGKIEITLKYTNNEVHNVFVNGKSKRLYTPFVVAFTTVIDGDNNKNISISNGTVTDNGKSNILLAVAVPGLYESMNMNELKGMDEITITYDTKCFELSSMYNIITPKLIDTSDLKVFDKVNSLYKSTNDLKSNMDKLEGGASELRSGSKLLKDGLNSAIKEVKNNNGDVLTEEQINGIKMQTIESAKAGLNSDVQNVIANTAWDKVKKTLDESNDPTIENYVKSSVINMTKLYLGDETNFNYYAGCISGNTDACALLTSNGVDINKVNLYVQNTTNELASTAKKISYYVAENITKNVAKEVSYNTAIDISGKTATSLAPTIANGVKKEILDVTSKQLNELYNGVNMLDGGIISLSDGISLYNKEGITKLSNMVINNIKPTIDTTKELTKLSNNYNSFANDKSNRGDDTKFIYVIDSKKAPKVDDNIKINKETTTFWQRLKNLFK